MRVRQSVPLAGHTTLGVGGPATYFCEPSSESEVADVVAWADDRALPLYVLGGGSNIVVSDDGLQGVTLKMVLRGVRWNRSETRVKAAAGETWDNLVVGAVERGWAGFECLTGIPGLVGATPIQNVGAYGQEVSDTLYRVRVFDRQAGRIRALSSADCALGYRDSVFRHGAPGRYIVLTVEFALRAGERPTLRYGELAARFKSHRTPGLSEVRREVLELRRAKSMLLDRDAASGRSCGSFFINPVVAPADVERVRGASPTGHLPRFPQQDGRVKLSAAWLIEQAGFPRGTRSGSVGLSPKHALAIVCHPGAKAGDVVALARTIQQAVAERFAILLEPEPAFWGFPEGNPLSPARAA